MVIASSGFVAHQVYPDDVEVDLTSPVVDAVPEPERPGMVTAFIGLGFLATTEFAEPGRWHTAVAIGEGRGRVVSARSTRGAAEAVTDTVARAVAVLHGAQASLAPRRWTVSEHLYLPVRRRFPVLGVSLPTETIFEAETGTGRWEVRVSTAAEGLRWWDLSVTLEGAETARHIHLSQLNNRHAAELEAHAVACAFTVADQLDGALHPWNRD